MIHVLVADPIPIFRAGLRRMLLHEPDFSVAEAATLAGALQSAQRCVPAIVLVDQHLPPAGGIEAIEQLLDRVEAPVALWTLHPDTETVVAAARAGASGCLPKGTSPGGLVRALRALSRGEAVVPRPLQAAVLAALRQVDVRERARTRASQLTLRERQVLALVATGARNRQIADELHISEFTVKRHVQKIFHKLEVASRGAAASFYDATLEASAVGATR